MNKYNYQLLRWSVECHVASSISDPVTARSLIDAVMQDFVQAISSAQVARASGKRAFVTFRRDVKSIPPSWAFSKPGISSRLPTL